jgi:hypothetical protein
MVKLKMIEKWKNVRIHLKSEKIESTQSFNFIFNVNHTGWTHYLEAQIFFELH